MRAVSPDALKTLFKAVVAVCATLATLAGGVAGWGALGLPVPATRALVQDEVGKVVKVVIELARAERARLSVNRASLQDKRNTLGLDPAFRDALDRLIQQDDDAISDATERIISLEKLRQ